MSLRIPLLLSCSLIAILLSGSYSKAQPPTYKFTDLTNEQLKLLKWMDQIRIPDLEKHQAYLESRVKEELPDPLHRDIYFVIDHTSSTQTKFQQNYETRLDEFTEEPGEEYKSCYDTLTVNPVEFANELLDSAKQITEMQLDHPWGLSVVPDKYFRLSFWAWICWRHHQFALAGGLLKESERLYNTAPQNARSFEGDESATKKMSHNEWIEEYLSDKLYQRFTEKFADLRLSRHQLLDECSWFLEKFPHCNKRPWVVQIMDELATMLVEDDLHRQTVKPFHQLTHYEQIDELIFQLRNQTASRVPSWYANYCDLFAADQKGAPAQRLVEYGFDAVPQLIEALSCTRVTRINGWIGNYVDEAGGVARVNGCCEQILTKIFHKELRHPMDTIDFSSGASLPITIADQYRDWYVRYLQVGEIEMLVEGTEAGDDENCASQAARLAQLNPEKALSAVQIGLLRIRNYRTIPKLIEVLMNIPGDQTTAALIKLAYEAPYQDCRIYAAAALSHRGNDEGLKAALIEWHQARVPRATDQTPDAMFDKERCLQLLYLIKVGRVEAIVAIGNRIRSDRRALNEFLEACHEFAEDPESWRLPKWLFNHRDMDPRESCRDALEQLLFDIVENLAPEPDETIDLPQDNGNQKSLSDAEVRLQVVELLPMINPARYSLEDLQVGPAEERAYILLKQSWQDAIEARTEQQVTATRWPVLSAAELQACRIAAKVPKTELQRLIEETESGTEASIASVKVLIKKYPDSALPAIRAGMIRAEFFEACDLIAAIAEEPSEVATAALIEEVDRNSNNYTVAVAAAMLQRRNRPEGVQTIVREWIAPQGATVTEYEKRYPRLRSEIYTQFLLMSGEVEEIQIIKNHVKSLRPMERLDLLWLFNRQDSNFLNDKCGLEDVLTRYAKSKSTEWRECVEQILFEILDDHSDVEGFSAEKPLKWYFISPQRNLVLSEIKDLRYCDLAALALRNLDSRRFAFTDEEQDADAEAVITKLKEALSVR